MDISLAHGNSYNIYILTDDKTNGEKEVKSMNGCNIIGVSRDNNRLSCNLISPITGVEFIINGIPYRATVLPLISDPLNPQLVDNALRFTSMGWC
ncbi:hypothetical protein DDW09_04790 [Sulfolobus sp. SCGC AB-777_L09]|nr:hypothetical protein DDW09_04790 [Sulfolobus sp. SCGC AB-777_L09]